MSIKETSLRKAWVKTPELQVNEITVINANDKEQLINYTWKSNVDNHLKDGGGGKHISEADHSNLKAHLADANKGDSSFYHVTASWKTKVYNHLANEDIHVTANWKTNVYTHLADANEGDSSLYHVTSSWKTNVYNHLANEDIHVTESWTSKVDDVCYKVNDLVKQQDDGDTYITIDKILSKEWIVKVYLNGISKEQKPTDFENIEKKYATQYSLSDFLDGEEGKYTYTVKVNSIFDAKNTGEKGFEFYQPSNLTYEFEYHIIFDEYVNKQYLIDHGLPNKNDYESKIYPILIPNFSMDTEQ